MKRILTIGDVHGRDKWMFHTHGSPYEFNHWVTMIENGVPSDDIEFWKEMPYTKYDQIVFVGDYVDSFNINNEGILNNLKNIILFKKYLPDKVILLLGNHDIQYFIPNEICSGYRAEMKPDLYRIFTENKDLFKVAHLLKDNEGKKYLWTHAGVTKGWIDDICKDIYNPKYKKYEITKDFNKDDLDNFLNNLFELRVSNIFNVDPHSGGYDLWAGPFWVRPSVLNDYPLEGVNQIVGHTPQKMIKDIICGNVIHYFVDCLWDDYDDVLILDLEI
jgi:hypothetical protein